MASNSVRILVRRSTNSAKALLRSGQSSCSSAAGPPKLNGVASSTSGLSPRHRLFFSSRLPVELVCGESLMPLHSVTASALLKSMLASKVGRWGYLSEGRFCHPTIAGPSGILKHSDAGECLTIVDNSILLDVRIKCNIFMIVIHSCFLLATFI